MRDVPWKELDSLLVQFLRLLFKLPKSFPKAPLLWSTEATSLQTLVTARQFKFWIRVRELKEDHPSSWALKEQEISLHKGKDCWLKMIRNKFQRYGYSYVWNFGPPTKSFVPVMLRSIQMFHLAQWRRETETLFSCHQILSLLDSEHFMSIIRKTERKLGVMLTFLLSLFRWSLSIIRGKDFICPMCYKPDSRLHLLKECQKTKKYLTIDLKRDIEDLNDDEGLIAYMGKISEIRSKEMTTFIQRTCHDRRKAIRLGSKHENHMKSDTNSDTPSKHRSNSILETCA